MTQKAGFLLIICCCASVLIGTEYHVSPQGNDSHSGAFGTPFRTIQCAAEKAMPGDVITVHEGVYRERVNPPRGGESEQKRIVYRAVPGEKVEIKGSEIVKNWEKVQNDTWKVVIPHSFFGDFNPFQTEIKGDWFQPKNRLHHLGAVYLNGEWLVEANNKEEVLLAGSSIASLQPQNLSLQAGLWFAEAQEKETTIWAQFPKVDPNQEMVEVNVRQSVFYPDQPGRNYITVCGFIMCHAATPWAPPTAEQIGLLGTHWSKGWIIENNIISHSVCTGITLGKYGDEFDNTSANTAEGYVETIKRAHAFSIPWTREQIGHHLVRNNTISHCEQAGLVGSMGAAFSTITDNTIHDIHVRRLFTGAEMAGIKIHGAIDSLIARNHVYRTCLALWLDWMAQGTLVSGNLCHDNIRDLYVEVNHGPYLIDNNIFLSPFSVMDWSQGGSFVHNLIAGAISIKPHEKRETPFHPPHSTEVAGLHDNPCGDNQFYNNVFVDKADLSVYDQAPLPIKASGNIYLQGAKPSRYEELKKESSWRINSSWKIEEDEKGFWLDVADVSLAVSQGNHPFITTDLLGKTSISGVPLVNPDDSSLRIDNDYFGGKRSGVFPQPGPFEHINHHRLLLAPAIRR